MSQEAQVNQIIKDEEEEEEGEIEFGDPPIDIDVPDEIRIPPDKIRIPPEENPRKKLDKFKKEKRELFYNKYKPSTEASLRIIEDLVIYEVEKREGNLMFTAEPIGNDIFVWTIKVNRFIEGSELYKDIQKYKLRTRKDYVEFKALFPPNYPHNPPFIYCVQPRFEFHTGHITIGGSIYHEIFSKDIWSPTLNIVSMMNYILVDIFDGNPRIDFSNDQPYSLESAKEAFERVAKNYDWDINLWF